MRFKIIASSISAFVLIAGLLSSCKPSSATVVPVEASLVITPPVTQERGQSLSFTFVFAGGRDDLHKRARHRLVCLPPDVELI
jgi:hypothetical protein